MSVIEEIAAERRRQVEAEGWSTKHDDEHGNGELAAAGAAYAFSASTEGRYLAADPLGFWPWDKSWWKPKGARRDLIRAAALIVAEIERIDRADTLTPEAAWQDLVDKDDRTSPEEYPDMALITFEELRDYMENR